jgi:transposase
VEVERMMKLQDVLLKAMAKKMTWWQAAEIIGVSDRTMRRWRDRMREHGYSGLTDRRKGKPSDKRVPLATAEEVLRLFQEIYYDLNIRHFHEKLGEKHGFIELQLGAGLQGAGWWLAQGRGKAAAGTASNGAWCTSTAASISGSGTNGGTVSRNLDDANTEIYYAQLVEEESTRTVMVALLEVVGCKGLFCALLQRPKSFF